MDAISQLLSDVLDEVRPDASGAVADYIPQLASADPDRLGLAIIGPRAGISAVGDADTAFTIQSISKAMVFALAVDRWGPDAVMQKVDVEPSGEPFNAISLEKGTGRPANPLINAGALAVTSLIPGADIVERSATILAGLSAFAGRDLAVDEDVYRSESATGDRNRALGHLLRSYGIFTDEVDDVVETYFRQCSALVTVQDLCVMAGTLAFGGRNPLTGERVVSERSARDTVAVMSSCGMYDNSGEWLLRVGLPAKSGVAGGLIAISPSQFGVGVFSPRLDAHGNTVRGQMVLEKLSERFGMHVFEAHEAVATPEVAIREDGDELRVILGGELSFSGVERVLTRLRDIDLPGRSIVIDAGGLAQVHPMAIDVLRRQVSDSDRRVRVEG